MRHLPGILAVTALGAALALSGCASTSPVGSALDAALVSSVDPSTRPAFLDTPQTDADLLEGDTCAFGVDPDSLRYQGDWEGGAIYLGVTGESTVVVVTVDLADPALCSAGQSTGNTPVASGSNRSEERWLAYAPHGSDSPPEGWRAFSPHMIALD